MNTLLPLLQVARNRVSLTVIVVAGLSWATPSGAFELKASAGLSQFDTSNAVVYASDNPIFNGPEITSSREGPNAKAIASASPRELRGEFSTLSSGIATPFAEAGWDNTGIIFRDLNPLQRLINPTQGFIDLALNFDVSYYLETETNPGLFRQATSHAFVNFASRYQNGVLVYGTADSLNFPDKHTFDNRGIFTGLPEQGGNVVAKVPIRIYSHYLANPYYLNDQGEFFVPFVASARVSGLALSDTPSKGRVRVAIPDLASFVTTVDGTSLSSFGVDMSLVPDAPSTSVPTPALLPGLLGLALNLWRKQQRTMED